MRHGAVPGCNGAWRIPNGAPKEGRLQPKGLGRASGGPACLISLPDYLCRAAGGGITPEPHFGSAALQINPNPGEEHWRHAAMPSPRANFAAKLTDSPGKAQHHV
jgi:hypothetical protein